MKLLLNRVEKKTLIVFISAAIGLAVDEINNENYLPFGHNLR